MSPPGSAAATPGEGAAYRAWRDRYAEDADRCANYERVREASPTKRLSGRFDGRMVRRALADLPPGSLVLDLPCGGGRISRALGPLEFRMVAADYSPWMLHESAGSAARRVRADALRLPFRDDAFAAVVCFRFMQAVPRELRIRTLEELGRVSGRVVVSYANATSLRSLRRSLLGRSPRPNRVSQAQVAEDVAAAGLELLAFEYKVRLFFEDFVVIARRASRG